ncbi:MAG: hypothetical protein CMI54_07355 [Parcubacteria group bacterium]|nr:hypothetical protein [Parcubacteria group bacterium]
MTDKEILDEVYRQLKEPLHKMPQSCRAHVWKHKIAIRFIEREWQREDEIEEELDKLETSYYEGKKIVPRHKK